MHINRCLFCLNALCHAPIGKTQRNDKGFVSSDTFSHLFMKRYGGGIMNRWHDLYRYFCRILLILGKEWNPFCPSTQIHHCFNFLYHIYVFTDKYLMGLTGLLLEYTSILDVVCFQLRLKKSQLSCLLLK